MVVFMLCLRPTGCRYKLISSAAISPGPLHYSIPQPERVVLDNGMILYLLEDHEIPLIEVTALSEPARSMILRSALDSRQ